jgi:hypothetical protein
MTKEIDYFKIITGRTFDEFTATPSFDQTLSEQIKRQKSKYPLRLLGKSKNGKVYISEEEREVNYHIVGAPGEGKSRFLEYNIRKDIEMGNGLCLLDPSDDGDTCKKILRYCAKNGRDKVLYIDPATLSEYGKIATLQPLNPKYQKQSVDGVMEAINNVFGVARETDTPRIRKYLPAVLRFLVRNGLTLYESQMFRRYADPKQLPLGFDTDSQTIRDAFRSQFTWENYFSSTINRLDLFWQEPLSLMLGTDHGIDFIKMIREKWIILVNLYPSSFFSLTESRLLGILVISQIIQAIDILRHNGWKGVFYLYMDEAARFATPQIDQVLSYKRKSGLRLMLAHHYFNQFENKQVMHSIKQNARVKVMFNTPSYDDRLEMVKDLGYGGDIPPLLASYANQDIPKQYAIVKKNKETPVRIRVPDVPDIDADIKPYIESLLTQPWYQTREQIQAQINARAIHTPPVHTAPPKPRAVPDRKAASDPPKAGRKSLLDLGPEAEKFIRDNKAPKGDGG